MVPGLSASSSSTTPSPTSHHLHHNGYTENTVPERSGSTRGELRETRCMNQPKKRKRIRRRTKRYIAWIAWLATVIQREYGLMRVLQQSLGETQSRKVKTRPSHLMNFQWSCEQKVEPGSGEHSVYTHLPKDPNCDVCLKTKNNKGILQKTCWYSRAQSGTFWWHDYCGSQSSQWRKWIAGTIIDVPWWYKTWQHSGYNHTRVKQNLPRETQKNLMKFLEPDRKPKSHLHWQFLGIWQVLRGIILESLYVNTTQIRKQMGLPKEQCAEWNKGHLQCYCCNQVWVTNGGRIPMACYCYLPSVTDLLSDGKTPYERWFGMLFDGPVIPFGAMVEYHPVSAKANLDCICLEQKSCQVFFSVMYYFAAGIWKGDIMVADIEEFGWEWDAS